MGSIIFKSTKNVFIILKEEERKKNEYQKNFQKLIRFKKKSFCKSNMISDFALSYFCKLIHFSKTKFHHWGAGEVFFRYITPIIVFVTMPSEK